jgi:acyl phosphate:glycerol-3-phosphate acyltransferase
LNFADLQMDTFVPLIVGYTLGSLPIGYLIASKLRGIDLRRVGSGNVGATNVYRSAGLATALLVIVVDVAKGAGSVLLAARILADPSAPAAAGVAAIVGHVYPVWLRFRGGKGVATACGAFSILAPVATAIAGGLFVVTVWATRYVSLGSIVATITLPSLAWLTRASLPVVSGGVIAALLIVERHRGNLARLRAGTERRLGQRI